MMKKVIEATADLVSLTNLTCFNRFNQFWQLNQFNLTMAAARCHGCDGQLVGTGDGRQCNFCCRWYHEGCTISTGLSDRGEWLCNFGCAQAYEAGKRDAHSKRLTLRCYWCGETFSSRSNLLTHIEGVHRGRRHGPCPGCKKDFASKQKFKQHLERCRKRTLQQIQDCEGVAAQQGGPQQGDPTSPTLRQLTSAIAAEHSIHAATTPHAH